MDRFKAVKWFIRITIAVIAIVDVYLIRLANGHVDFDNSISSQLYTWSQEYPIVTLIAGILIGHLFWPNTPRKDEK